MFCHVIRPNVFIESISRLSHELRFYVRIIQLTSQSNQTKIKIVHLRYNQHGSPRHNNCVTVLNFKLSKANLFCSAGVSTLMLVSSSLMQRITSSICRSFCILLVTSYMQMYNDDASFYFVFFEYWKVYFSFPVREPY